MTFVEIFSNCPKIFLETQLEAELEVTWLEAELEVIWLEAELEITQLEGELKLYNWNA